MWLKSLRAAWLWILNGCSELFENEILKVNCAQHFSAMEAPRCSVSMMTRIQHVLGPDFIPHARPNQTTVKISQNRVYFTELVTAASPIIHTDPVFQTIIQTVVISDTAWHRRKEKEEEEEEMGWVRGDRRDIRQTRRRPRFRFKQRDAHDGSRSCERDPLFSGFTDPFQWLM